MRSYSLLELKNIPSLIPRAATWFSEKWGIAVEAYLESMNACVTAECSVPAWYVVWDGNKIIGGVGVIANDFHERRDLTPNICAVYVEEDYRGRGIAGAMLRYVCDTFANKGFQTLYLVTEHTSFYERYGFEFLCMVKETECEHFTRMYRRILRNEALS